jgi:hypothetical protein
MRTTIKIPPNQRSGGFDGDASFESRGVIDHHLTCEVDKF